MRETRGRPRWQPDAVEVYILTELYKTNSLREMGIIMGCTKENVRQKLEQYGIKRISRGRPAIRR